MLLFLETVFFISAIVLSIKFRRNIPAIGARKLFYQTILLSFWLMMDALFYMDLNQQLSILFHKMKFISIVSVPVLFLLTTAEYNRIENPLGKRDSRLLWIVPAITIMAIISDHFTKIVWLDISVVEVNGYPFIITQNNVMFWVHTLYCYALVLWAFTMLFRRAGNSPRIYRKQSLFILIGCLVTWLLNVIFVTSVQKTASIPFDPTPLSLLLSYLVLYWGLFRMTKKVIIPLARDLVIENMKDMVIVLDTAGTIIDINPAAADFARKLEIRRPVAGSNFHELIKDLEGLTNEDVSASGRRIVTNETGGSKTYFETEFSTIYDGNKDIVGQLVILHDVTDTQKALERLKYLSCYDQMTGIYNRGFFEAELERLNALRQLPLSVIVADVNGLKIVNDAFGHSAGDEVLRKVARLFREVTRSEDIIARIGGDEFAVILPKASEEVALKIIKRIRYACNKMGGKPVPISVSLGFATKNVVEEDILDILKEADANMYKRKLLESKSIHSELVPSLIRTLKESSFETDEHAERMKDLAQRLGKALGLSGNQMDDLLLLALLHDLGKVAIPSDIIKKKGKLTPQEWEIMKRHSEIGYHIAASSKDLSSIAELILSHHEWWDGTGYPRKLTGEEIPYLSRILSVIDAYDVMTHDSPYQAAVGKEEAVEEIRRCAGSQFDPAIVEIFCEVV